MQNDICNYHLNSARGWIELGNCIEASNELEKIVPSLRTHPDILELRWQIYANGQLWTAAFEMALAICEIAPERPSAWVCQAESLSRRGQVSRARDVLLGIVNRFSNIAVIPYKLASYSSMLNLAGEAREWIERAMVCRDFREIAHQALQDPSLTKVRGLIQLRLARITNAEALFSGTPMPELVGQNRSRSVFETNLSVSSDANRLR
ncbi:MAG: tetratricopeptide repeat protein [Verrucomicrobia bacterium]|nr:tetratricopeptide repeat protein [Verrucomicrobiota bacterium]